jgi:YidC/Oxa1 family membrane protein insertase
MDKLRLSVWVALAALLYIAFLMWQQDYPPPTSAPIANSSPPTTSTIPSLPGEAATTTPQSTPASVLPATLTTNNVQTAAPSITIRTDVIDLTVSLQGGELDRADLLKYPAQKDQPETLVRLFDKTSNNYFLARSGLRAADNRPSPTSEAIYSASQTAYELKDGQDTLTVPLTWTDGQGVTVTKAFTFKRGRYAFSMDYNVDNQSSTEWRAASYLQITRRQPISDASMLQAERYAFMGPAVSDGKSIKNLKLDKDESKNFHASYTGGWLAAMQHHFVVAAVPDPAQAYDYQLGVESTNQYTITSRGPLVTVAPGSKGSFHETLFVGPKLQDQLAATGQKLDLTADYGNLTIVARPLFWLLNTVHSLIGNWGWSIILVTLLIKLAFYKLTETSGKSMAKMREMAPRLKALQERYKDDREQLGRATMEFYKREKINPLAGCLPTLIQMPVFMAFYWVILNSAEMRQAPFIGYLVDLSTRDPYFILPIILGVANFMQFKLNPAPADPIQAKVMMMMPIVMTGMMVMFPSGLVLYWITNTSLSILQQWHINRVVSGATKKT